MELIIILVLIIGFVSLGFLLKKNQSDQKLLEVIKILERGSTESSNSLNQRLDNAAKVISEVQKSLGEIGEIGRSMRDLEDFLKNPKIRGNIGEQILKELIAEVLPKGSFNLQYEFRSGNKVDAAIKTKGGIIPIDSKFPMENFRKMSSSKIASEKMILEREFVKDVKKHIESISKKYINPEEGTIDYALMYIPSESVYYEIVNNHELFDFSGKNKVLPVSPTTFYAYIKAILMSFEGQKIEERAKIILETLKGLEKDYLKVETSLSILQKHITNAGNTMSDIWGDYTKLGQKLSSTKMLK